jgi:hypothetical protein
MHPSSAECFLASIVAFQLILYLHNNRTCSCWTMAAGLRDRFDISQLRHVATALADNDVTDKQQQDSSWSSSVRYYRLHDMCSGNLVRVTDRHVDVNNSAFNYPYYDLKVESVGFGLVRFQGVTSRHYICLNKAGNKLISRVRHGSSRHSRCTFREQYSSNHLAFEFRSVANDQYYMTFSQVNSRTYLHRTDHDRRQRLCRQFLKLGETIRHPTMTDSRWSVKGNLQIVANIN